MDVIVEIYSTSDFILRGDFLFYNENPLVLQAGVTLTRQNRCTRSNFRWEVTKNGKFWDASSWDGV